MAQSGPERRQGMRSSATVAIRRVPILGATAWSIRAVGKPVFGAYKKRPQRMPGPVHLAKCAAFHPGPMQETFAKLGRMRRAARRLTGSERRCPLYIRSEIRNTGTVPILGGVLIGAGGCCAKVSTPWAVLDATRMRKQSAVGLAAYDRVRGWLAPPWSCTSR